MRTFKVKNEAGQAFDVDEDKLSEAEKDGYLPIVSNGKEEHRVSPKDFGAAEKDGYKPVFESDVSQLESALGGFVEGAWLGYGDELAGAVGGALDYVTQGGKLDYKDYYKIRRDLVRKNQEEAKEANPDTFLASNVGGSLVTALAPGMGFLNSAKGAGLATQVGKGALQGGLVGLGTSDADLTEGDFKGAAIDTATGAAIGGALPLAIKGVGAAASKVDDFTGISDKSKVVAQHLGQKFKDLPEFAARYGLDLPQDAISAIKADKTLLEASKSARSNDELIDLVQEQSKGAFKKQSSLSEEAWEALKKNDEIIGDHKLGEELSGHFRNYMKLVGEDLIEQNNLTNSSQAAQKSALKAIQNAMDDAGKVKNLQDIKRVIQSMDENINYEAKSDNLKNDVLNKFRHEVDNLLKGENTPHGTTRGVPEYKKAMQPLAEVTDSIEQVRSRMDMSKGVDSIGDKFLQASDNTRNAVDTLVKQSLNKKARSGAESELRKSLDNVSPEIGKELKASGLNKILSEDTARGTRSTFFGGALGALGLGFDVATGGMTTAAGLVAGYARDKFGRKVGAELIQSLNHGGFGKVLNGTSKGVEKYGKMLIDAAAKGDWNLAITHQLLLKKDEDYRKIFESED